MPPYNLSNIPPATMGSWPFDRDIHPVSHTWGKDVTVAMARHHITPKDGLRNLWETCAQQYAQNKHCKDFCNTIINALGYWKGKGSLLEQQNFEEALQNVKQHGIDPGGENLPGFGALIGPYLWACGNLFIGPLPERRSDDRGNATVEKCEVIVGRRRYGAFMALQSSMQAAVNQIARGTLSHIAEEMAKLVRQREEYRFDPAHWVWNGERNGKILSLRQPHARMTSTGGERMAEHAEVTS
ncbi:hypothetical protein H8N00_12590 [Streptomyces sp. AC563]|uniref:hypothetical protein n=1 Tax=Streptomyces buecherae TaxID=2763006 RepID=UPI00164EA259|nr:hypothetical protein [Streptomyces buecherae]MBC3989697.1 hypothetical protein [Streptomyces buecherae]